MPCNRCVSHTVYFAHGIARVKVKQEVGADTRIMQENSKKYGRKKRGHRRVKSPRQGLTSAENLTQKLHEKPDSHLL